MPRIDRCTSTAAVVHSGPDLLEPSSRSDLALTTDWHPEYISDHFRNFIDSSVVHHLIGKGKEYRTP